MKRIVIMGPPGSGKSTLARHLGSLHNLPVFHLDQCYWRPGWVANAPETFRAEVERVAALPAWVIDGNYTGTLAPRLREADTLIYLDVPTWQCMVRIITRVISSFGKVRLDGPPGCPERFDVTFLHFVYTWNRRSRTRNLALIQDFSGRKIIARNAEAISSAQLSPD